MKTLPGNNARQRNLMLALVCGLFALHPSVQASPSELEISEITANWKCQWCPYEKDVRKQGYIEAGLGGVTNDSYKFGKYTGLNEKKIYLLGNGGYEYKDGKSRYVEIGANDVGLDSRELAIKGGRQGKYDLAVQFSMLPSFNIDTARTPYRGTSMQTLPAGWVQAGSTAGMTELATSLRDVDIYTERKSIDVGAAYYVSPSLSYELNFQKQTRQGKKAMGLDFFFASSAILAVPIDTETNQGEIKVNYRGQHWQGSLGYDFSMFSNKHDYIRWESAFTGTPTTGQAAFEPDNFMQQITLDGVYHFSNDTQATVAAALGIMTQDEDFLPYTATSSLAALPRKSLDGNVNTFNGTLRLNSRLNKSWDYSIQYQHNEQENKTERATYDYLRTDTATAGTPRANLPFSFREREYSVQGRYQINVRKNITLGYEREINDRTYQEVETTNEDTLSALYLSKVNESLHWSLKINNSNRVGDDYVPVSEISPAEDPLLRKYNLADRKRRQVAASMSYLLTEDFQISVSGDYSDDDYFDSEIGLQESRQTIVALELQYQVNQSLAINLDYSATDIDSSQEGATWNANNEDSIYVAHLAVNYDLERYKLKIGADYTHASAIGDINVSTGSGFPRLESTRQTVTIYADYTINERSNIHTFFMYEDYDESDWAIDDVYTDTLGSVLSMGETSPSYDIGLFAVTYRTRF